MALTSKTWVAEGEKPAAEPKDASNLRGAAQGKILALFPERMLSG